jgi:hypothetical protein
MHGVRRATKHAEFLALCRKFLDHDEPMPLGPFAIPLNLTDLMAGAMR